MSAWRQKFTTIERVLEAAGDDRDAVRDALLSERSAERVAQVLAARDLTVSPSSIRTYRRAMRQSGEQTQ